MRPRWGLLPFLLLAFLAGCYLIPAGYDPVFSCIAPVGAQVPQDVVRWLRANLHYYPDSIHDSNEYWQSPDQTYIWRYGDCEDFALLMMYMVRQEIGGFPQLVIGQLSGTGHAWVRYEGVDYEPQGGVVDGRYSAWYTVGYAEALWRSENTHRSMLMTAGGQ